MKHGQNEKYLSKDWTLYIYSEHFEKDCFERDLQVSFINLYKNLEKLSSKQALINNFFESFCVFFLAIFQNFM